ncbi:hypothetical protein [uncultured Campylobacter sp.]|uniref:hypothetical protein n=1 Tax=uncultured Campylobacter sp. TaxID=218934 RepID=UPI0026388C69|nr:hypothetical protein [uncultured Campylobacter sp.]
MKYVHYDKKTNEILGYYDSEIHENIPAPNVEISEEQWTKAVNMGATHINPKTLETSIKIEEPPIEQLREAKTTELASWVNAMGESCKVEIKDFGAVNGGYKYLLNIGSMIDIFDSLEVRGFRMYDNTMKKINGQEDLKKIKRAIQIAGQKLHVLKWGYETAIEKAKTAKELEAIKFTDTIEV